MINFKYIEINYWLLNCNYFCKWRHKQKTQVHEANGST